MNDLVGKVEEVLTPELLRRLVEGVPALVAVLSEEGHFAWLNPAWTTLLGWQPEELLGKHFSEFNCKEEREATADAVAAGMSGRHTAGFVSRVRAKDGSFKEVSWSGPGNSPPYGIAIGIELTALRAAEKEALEAGARLQSFLGMVPGYISIIEEDFCFSYTNRTYPGLRVDQVVGTNLLNWLAPDHREPMRASLKALFAGQSVPSLVTVGTGQDGGTTWYRTSFGLLQRDGAQSAILYGEDITTQKRAEHARSQASRLEAVGRVTSALAHDLNNMLMAIGAATELVSLAVEDGNKVDKEDLALLMSAMDRARGLTGNLMASFRGNAEGAESIDLVHTIRELKSLLGHATKGRVTVEMQLPEVDIPVGLASHEVSQLLLNLVVNAAEAATGQDCIWIKVCEEELPEDVNTAAGKFAVIEVRDNGPGIPRELRDRIFDPFFTTKSSGSGIGLATCYSIARSCRGDMNLLCPEEGGAVFRIVLPRFKAKRSLGEAAAPVTDALKGKKILKHNPTVLLAEDSPLTRVALAAR